MHTPITEKHTTSGIVQLSSNLPAFFPQKILAHPQHQKHKRRTAYLLVAEKIICHIRYRGSRRAHQQIILLPCPQISSESRNKNSYVRQRSENSRINQRRQPFIVRIGENFIPPEKLCFLTVNRFHITAEAVRSHAKKLMPYVFSGKHFHRKTPNPSSAVPPRIVPVKIGHRAERLAKPARQDSSALQDNKRHHDYHNCRRHKHCRSSNPTHSYHLIRSVSPYIQKKAEQ